MGAQDTRELAGDRKTGVLVLNARPSPVLSPFFGKCDGMLVVEPDGQGTTFYPRDRDDPLSLWNLILAVKPTRLICGFVPPEDRAKLREAGIDVRLGSCATAVEELVACFCDLPEA